MFKNHLFSGLLIVLLLVLAAGCNLDSNQNFVDQNQDGINAESGMDTRGIGSLTFNYIYLNSDSYVDQLSIDFSKRSCKTTLRSTNGILMPPYTETGTAYFGFNDYIAIGDFNKDGNKDYLAIEGTYCYIVPGVLVREGYYFKFEHENRVFGDACYYGYEMKQIVDINRDRWLDFVAINRSTWDCYVLPGTSAGDSLSTCKFNDAARHYANACYYSNAYTITFWDATGDGYLDLVADTSDHTYIIPGTIAGYFDDDARILTWH